MAIHTLLIIMKKKTMNTFFVLIENGLNNLYAENKIILLINSIICITGMSNCHSIHFIWPVLHFLIT